MSLVQELKMEPEVNQRLMDAPGVVWPGLIKSYNGKETNNPHGNKQGAGFFKSLKNKRALDFLKTLPFNKWQTINKMATKISSPSVSKYAKYLVSIEKMEEKTMLLNGRKLKHYRRIK